MIYLNHQVSNDPFRKIVLYTVKRLTILSPFASVSYIVDNKAVIETPVSRNIKAFDENGNVIDYKTQLGRKTGFVVSMSTLVLCSRGYFPPFAR